MNSLVLVTALIVAALGNIARLFTPSGRERLPFHALIAFGSLAMALSVALGTSSGLATWSGLVGACTFVCIGLLRHH